MEERRKETWLTREEAEVVFGSAERLNAAIVEAVRIRHKMRGSVHPNVLLAIFRREKYGGARLTAYLTEEGWRYRIKAEREEDIARIRDDLAICLSRRVTGNFLDRTVAGVFA